MSNTKGKWKRRYPRNGEAAEIIEDYDGKSVALILSLDDCHRPIDKSEVEANANLIVAAANACIKVNPDNPQAAAEALPDIYDALGECLLLIEDMMPGVAGIALQNYQRLNEAPINARTALAKARKK